MRIVAGEFGGRRLQVPAGRSRPTSDRARESLFAALGGLAGTDVLDVFAGSGALGLEALSRGARTCVFCEVDRPALTAIRANVDALGVAARVTVVAGDARRALARLADDGRAFDLILLDPPYSGHAEFLDALAPLLGRLLAADGALVVESPMRTPPPELDGFAPSYERTFGEARIAILRRAAP